jgi:hypothetical protein
MLPLYPSFRAIQGADQEFITKFTQDFLPYSDFVFSSLYAWNQAGEETQLSRLNDNLVVRLRDGYGEKLLLTFLGRNKLAETAMRLLEDAPSLNLLPYEVAIQLGPTHFVIAGDARAFDYLYDIDEVVACWGSRYEGLRRELKRYTTISAFGITVTEMDVGDSITVRQLLALFDQWASARSDARAAQIERNALERYLTLGQRAESVNLGAFHCGELVGFTLSEVLANRFSYSPIAKAHRTKRGLNKYLFYATAVALQKRGCKCMNTDCDLSIAGLRQYKNSWHPCYKLPKYQLFSALTSRAVNSCG